MEEENEGEMSRVNLDAQHGQKNGWKESTDIIFTERVGGRENRDKLYRQLHDLHQGQ